MSRPVTFFALAVIYLLLSGNASPLNLIVGALLAGLVVLLLRPVERRTGLRLTPSAIRTLLGYSVRAFYDLVVGGIQVARLVIDPRVSVRPGILAIPTETVSELGTALSAHALSLAPGELVLEIDDDGVMYTHVLDAADADAHLLEGQRIRRDLLSKILSSDAEGG